MSLPAISVIVPAYNAERFLAASIESVLAQDLPPREIVVVDDGSTDRTPAIVASFGDRVRSVAHETNRGEAAARNTGLAATTGPVVSMHDADDLMRPERLRLQAEALVAAGDPDRVGCALGRQAAFTEDGGPLPTWMLGPGGEALPYGDSLVLAWRSTYETVGGYDESFPTGTDSDWLVRVRAASLEIVLMDEVLTDRRIHDANVSGARSGPHGSTYTRSLRQVLHARRARS